MSRRRTPAKFMGVKVKRISEEAIVPVRATRGAAGYDLFSPVEMEIKPGQSELVPLHLRMEVPFGYCGQIAARSSIAKLGVIVEAGTIDSDYRGPVLVMLYNHSQNSFFIKRGDRIAQMVVQAICTLDMQEVDSIDETARGEGGFGSTGRNQIVAPKSRSDRQNDRQKRQTERESVHVNDIVL